MSVVLADRLFVSHDQGSFYTPFTSKHIAFQTLERALDISSLDFFVSLSSAATFGNIGQTNYARCAGPTHSLIFNDPNAL